MTDTESSGAPSRDAAPPPPPPPSLSAPSSPGLAGDDLEADLPAALRSDEKAFSTQILQFFLFPLLLVITCLAIFFIFGIAGSHHANVDDLLLDIRQGGPHARRVAAYDLARMMIADYQEALRTNVEPELARNPRIADTMLKVLGEPQEKDTDFVRYLIVVGGYTQDPRFVPPVLERLEAYYASAPAEPAAAAGAYRENDTEVELYMALVRIADPSMLARLGAWFATGNVDTRKLIVLAAGSVRNEESTNLLLKAVADDAVNVNWNAALQLAARGHEACVPVLTKMLDPAYVASAPAITEVQVREALMGACAAAGMIKAPALREPLQRLVDGYGDPRVVNAAREALTKF